MACRSNGQATHPPDVLAIPVHGAKVDVVVDEIDLLEQRRAVHRLKGCVRLHKQCYLGLALHAQVSSLQV